MSDGFSIGIGLLVKFLKPLWTGLTFLRDALSKRYLLPLYERSHRLYQQRCILGAYWEPLTQYIEYSIEITNVFDHLNGRKQRVALRKQPNIICRIDSATLIVEAHNDGYLETERIVTGELEDKPQLFTLHNIPIVEIYVENKGIHTSYNTIWIKVKEIISEGKKLPDGSDTTFFLPSHYSYLNETYVKKWGRFWNLWLFDQAKEELHIHIMYALDCHPLLDDSLWGNIRLLTGRILTHRFVLNQIFWAAVIFRFMNIDDEGDITCNLRWLNTSMVRKLLRVKDKVFQ